MSIEQSLEEAFKDVRISLIYENVFEKIELYRFERGGEIAHLLYSGAVATTDRAKIIQLLKEARTTREVLKEFKD